MRTTIAVAVIAVVAMGAALIVFGAIGIVGSGELGNPSVLNNSYAAGNQSGVWMAQFGVVPYAWLLGLWIVLWWCGWKLWRGLTAP